MATCPRETNEPPPRSDCDLNEIWNNAWNQARAEVIPSGAGALADYLLNLLGGAVGGVLGRAANEFGANRLLRGLTEGAGGGATSGAQENASDDGITVPEFAGIVAGAIAGAVAVITAPVGIGLGASLFLGAALATAVGWLTEIAVRANEIAAEARANQNCDNTDQPDQLPGSGAPATCPPVSPLIIDLDGDGVETLSISEAAVFFDLDADGRAERTGWVAPDDALLVLDRNADGRINDITELFGSETEDGFSELAREDSNSDGVIDAADTVFEDLRLWRDANVDGIAQEDELLTLAEAGITLLSLNATEVDDTVPGGIVTHAGLATRADGGTAEILDVWFNNDRAWTEGTDETVVSVAAARLPILKGSGRVEDLQVAMDDDPALMEAVRDLLIDMPTMSSAQYRQAIEALVLQWAGLEDVDVGSRGLWMDGQHLAVLEAFLDFQYRQLSGTNAGRPDPGPNAAYVIEQQYDDLISRFMTEFAAQANLSSVLLLTDLVMAEDPRAGALAAAIEDSSAIALASLSFDDRTNRVALSSAENAIADLIRAIPEQGAIAYLDRYLGRLAGLEREHFGTDRAAWESWLNQQLAPIEDRALRHVAFDLARGFSLVAGTAGDDDLISGDVAPAGLVRQPRAQQSVLTGGAGNDTLDGQAGGDTYVFGIGDGQDTIDDSFFIGIGGLDGGSRVDAYGEPLTIPQPNVYAATLDTVVFPGRNLADAVFTVDGEDLVIIFNDASGDSLRIVGQFRLPAEPQFAGGTQYFPAYFNAIERFVFADSTTDRSSLSATDGDDNLIGSLNDEAFEGGLGNDTLNGNGGNDVFIYSAGDGDDVIQQTPIPETGDWQLGAFVGDRILLTDLDLGDVTLTRSGADVTLGFTNGGSITILGQGRSERLGLYALPAVEGVEFADGTILRMDLLEIVLNGVPDTSEYPNTYSVFDTAADGVVRSTGTLTNNDIFVSGAITATFDGRAGHDTYVLSLGDAPVTIVDRVQVLNDISLYQNDEDTLILTDMLFSDLEFQRMPGDDMVVYHLGTQIARITTQYRDNFTFGVQRRDGVETIIDASGEVFKREDWESRTVTVGTDGDDFLRGIDYIRNDDSVYYNSDIYRGGLGNDTINDENGSDTYLYALGDGNDTIIDDYGDFRYDPGNDEDRLVLTDLNVTDVRLERVDVFGGFEGPGFGFGSFGTLRVSVLADGGSVDVEGQFFDDLGGIELLEFADGTVWDKATIAERAYIFGTDGDDLIETFGAIEGATVVAGAGNDTVTVYGENVRALHSAADGSDELNGFAVIEFTDVDSDGVRLVQQTDGRLAVILRDSGETLLLDSTEDIPFGGGPGGPISVSRSALITRSDVASADTGSVPDDLREIRFASGEIWDIHAIAARIELPTTDGDDTVGGSDRDDLVLGGAGNDDLDGGAGNDTLAGGDGVDTLRGGDGDDVLRLSADGDALLDGGAGFDLLDASGLTAPLVIDLAAGSANGTPLAGIEDVAGGTGNDLISGDSADNWLGGGIGDDTLQGGDGNDTLEGGRGADLLSGGAGQDTASYATSLGGVTVFLDGSPGVGGHAAGDQLTGIEGLIGSNYSDSLVGDDGANVLEGLNGNDTLAGRAGDDLILGGAGDDAVTGDAGNDVIEGGDGRDTLQGGTGDDTLRGGAGQDVMEGGSGSDTYRWAPGDGDDIIIDNGPADDSDVLELQGVTQDDVRLVRIADQLNVFIGGTQTIRILDQFAGAGIEEIRFDDSSVLARADFAARALTIANQAPVAVPDTGLAVSAGTTVIAASTLLGNDSDFEGATLTIVAVDNAIGGSVSLDSDGNVVFVADRTTAQGSFAYMISDGELTATARVQVNIPPNAAPELAESLPDVAVPEDSAVSLTIPAGTFTDPDGDTLTLTATLADGAPLPSWLAFDGNSFAGVPPQDFNGTFEIRVTASDGVLEASDSFVLDITPVNDAPVATDDTGPTATAGTEVLLRAADLLANDIDIDGDTLSILSIAGANGGQATVTAEGDVRFVLDAGAQGTASFTYVVTDGALTDTATVTLSVTPAGPSDPYAGYVQGTAGRDIMFGSFFAADALFGAGGNDVLFGGLGNDSLAGGAGKDRIFGGFGHDLIEGNAGNDDLFGGFGSDVFVYREGDGADKIHDFRTGGWLASDRLALDVDGVETAAQALAHASQRGGKVVFDFGNGDTVTLLGMRLSWIGEEDILIL